MDPKELSDLFSDDHFSIESLLAKAQDSKLNLVELRNKLIQHQQDLNQTSLDLFNNSYDRFYKLSYIISCLAEPVQHLVDPIQGFRNQLGSICQNNDSYLEEINKKLVALEETGKNKELAKKLVQLIRRRERIEKQIESIDWSIKPKSATESVKTQQAANKTHLEYIIKCDLLERINVELHHLTCEVRAIQPSHDELIPIKKSLELGLDNRQAQFDKWFESTFLEAIELQDEAIIDLAIRTYQQTDSLDSLDLVWKTNVVKPYLNLTLIESQPSDQFIHIFELLDQFLARQLELVNAPFVANSFWQEVVAALDRLEKIYSLDDLETFQKRYLETRAFLEKQNQYLLSERVSIGLTQEQIESNKRQILCKFNLTGYFNHRLSQIASSVESSLAQQPLSEISEANRHFRGAPEESTLSKFKLKICMHIYALITKCWSPELYIDSLELDFSQLACRILSRFASWLGKLRLSDFRIIGPTTTEQQANRQTNFLAKQDAIMRLLLEDCQRLEGFIKGFLANLKTRDETMVSIREELVAESFKSIDTGLSNVRSLQRLIER